jgi:predicted nucleotidyltransferase component of viral defense system
MSNFDRRIARLEQVLEARDIADIARMTREERDQLKVEILTPYMGAKEAREHVHRLRTDPAYAEEERRAFRELKDQVGIIPGR